MKIELASKTGFCFGVKRAVRMAEAALKEKAPIYSLGSIIHNKQVVEVLSKKGLKVIKNLSKLDPGSTVVISSHGISPRSAESIRARGARIIDTTCPFVRSAQEIARRLSKDGCVVIIVGDANHPEVKALVDFAPKKVFVVKDKRQAKALGLKRGADVSIISQTTQSMNNFLDVVKVISVKAPGRVRVFNTICRDAAGRQDDAQALAGKVDLMLVIGGRDSANTRRLLQVCRKVLKRSYLIETEKDLNGKWFKGCRRIGITSGASTPDWIIRSVAEKIRSKKI